jgi:hypothetical protein
MKINYKIQGLLPSPGKNALINTEVAFGSVHLLAGSTSFGQNLFGQQTFGRTCKKYFMSQ